MMNRRDFLRRSAVASGAVVFPKAVFGETQSRKSQFTMWQLPLHQNNSQGNSYVFRTKQGKIIVMDGGVAPEAGYLRGFLGSLGNEVEAWFLSHPHSDHIGALNEILKNPDGIRIKSIFHSEFSAEFYNKVEEGSRALTVEFYENLKKTPARVIDVKEPGHTIEIDRVRFKILSVKNEEFTNNAYNNSSMVIRVSDTARSAVFLGDAGIEEGEKILASAYRKDLDCDYLQMAHHGQNGVNRKFYETVKFKACLWSTPRWLWDNNPGTGYNTGIWKTVETRQWVKELGIDKHYVTADGLYCI
ncbi:MAG: MBL fold metallo-hydrolase [Dysgonamonadaceae bacterium]|jgi:beta-lactamase superfamily II metal-dependent hydrolase|nr:MBL fold metallo-hydrolase [Dysgonamonadaceae bacterium]